MTTTTILNCSSWVLQTNYASKGFTTNLMALYMTAEYGAGTEWIASRNGVPNEISGEYTLGRVGLQHDLTAGQRGAHGSIPDMYFTAQGSVIGDTFPSDASKQFQQIGQMVVPSDGTTWLIS